MKKRIILSAVILALVLSTQSVKAAQQAFEIKTAIIPDTNMMINKALNSIQDKKDKQIPFRRTLDAILEVQNEGHASTSSFYLNDWNY